uniref:Methyltransferase like 21C n=1 Tax=Cyprinus carpio TaxID=7962 RepID=A0A8C1GFW1_CYPCA
EHVDLLDKAVLELGAGTGLVFTPLSPQGAMATDLPDVCCRYTPQVVALVWGQDVKRDFLSTIYNYNYVLCADVVYHHNFVEDLLITMQYFCKPGTTLLWANKTHWLSLFHLQWVRFQSYLRFIENFKNVFNVTLLKEIPQEEIRIYQATDLKK